MNIVVEKQPKCLATLSVEVPSSLVSSQRDSITSTYSSQARIPGFRPGKAPKNVILKRFEKQISEELQDSLFGQACDLALEKENLKVLDFGFPENINQRPDGSIAFDTKLTLAPEITLPDYKGIPIKSPSPEITEAEVDEQLESLRERLATFTDTSSRPLAADDIAVVDFTTTMDSQPLIEAIGEQKGAYLAKRENHWLPVKKDSFLPGYAPQLIGMNIGENRDISLTLDDEFPIPELRGKSLVLHTTLTGIKTAELPPLDDSFAAQLLPDKTLDDVKALIRENMGVQKLEQINEFKTNQIIDHLNKTVTFELPEDIVQRETQNQANRLVEQGSKQGASNADMLSQQEEIFSLASQRATSSLRTNFILQEIAQAENLSVSDAALFAHINKISQARKQPIKTVIKDLQKKRQIQSIRNSILIGQAVDFLLEHATVTEVSSDELTATPAE